MLQTIRDRAQGWIAWAIVALISVPFALWGIQSYLGVGGEPIAATVNGAEIPVRDLDRGVEQARLEMRERLGPAYDPAAFDDKRLRVEVLGSLIRETLLLGEVGRLGLRVSDQDVQIQVLGDPAFQKDGRFDKDAYERLLRYQGLTPRAYEEQLRSRLAASQLARAVTASELVTSRELADYQRLMDQKRELSYVTFPLSGYQSGAPIEESEITAFYEANRERFHSPEQVKVDYLVLDSETLASRVQVKDEELRAAYDADQARFAQPERRNVRHILRKVSEDADEKAAQSVLDEVSKLRGRILAGESFEEIAKASSEDPGSAASGGSLGLIEAGIMVPAFDKAAFAAEPGKVSEPVRTQFGYHLIEVTEIKPSQIKPFEEVRAQIKEELSKQRAEELYYDLGERLAGLTYESPDSLVPAAEALGLTVQHSDWISRAERGEGLLAQPKVIAAAFSDEVRLEGRNSDMVEPERDRLQAVVVHVTDHREASTKPLSEVRDPIVAELKGQMARKAAAAAADALLAKLSKTTDWAAADPALKPESLGLVDRRAANVPAPVLEAAFKLPRPGAGAASVGTTTLDSGDAAVVMVSRVEDGQPAPKVDGKPAAETYILTQIIGRAVSEAMIVDMESRARIENKAVSRSGADEAL
jgi:peptidyl-prolyl cis-trans isomerase D